MRSPYYPLISRHQRALTLNNVKDVVVMWNHDMRPLLNDGRFGHVVTHHMSRLVNRHQHNISVAEAVPDSGWWVMAVIAPVQDAKPASLDKQQAMVP